MNKGIILRVYVTNLAAYNRGDLVGEWVDLPCAEELSVVEKRILNELPGAHADDEELFITDSESDFGITVNEFDSFFDLNDLAYELADIITEHDDLNTVKAIFMVTDSREEALRIIRDREASIAPGVRTNEQLGMFAVEEGFFGLVDDENPLSRYIDYEAIGRDMCFEGWHIISELGLAICIH